MMPQHLGKRCLAALDVDSLPCSSAQKRMKTNSWRDQPCERTIMKPTKEKVKVNKHVLQKLSQIQLQSAEEKQKTPKLFSVKDLNDLLYKALEERETELREIHGNTLSFLVHEQVEALSKYNRECVAANLRKSEHDYY